MMKLMMLALGALFAAANEDKKPFSLEFNEEDFSFTWTYFGDKPLETFLFLGDQDISVIHVCAFECNKKAASKFYLPRGTSRVHPVVIEGTETWDVLDPVDVAAGNTKLDDRIYDFKQNVWEQLDHTRLDFPDGPFSRHSADDPPVKHMPFLKPLTTEALFAVGVRGAEGSTEVLHPMVPGDHEIQYLYITNKKGQILFFWETKGWETPSHNIAMPLGVGEVVVHEYCNKHGHWSSELIMLNPDPKVLKLTDMIPGLQLTYPDGQGPNSPTPSSEGMPTTIRSSSPSQEPPLSHGEL